MRLLLVVALLWLAVIFVVSFVRPRRSRQVQERVKRYTDRAAGKARDRGRDTTATAIEKTGHATQKVEHAGRRAHDEVFRSDAGAREERALERRYGEGAREGDE